MANRAFQKSLSSLHVNLAFLDCNFAVGATGAVGTVKGPGIASVVRLDTGTYQIILQDQYNRYLGGGGGLVEAPTGGAVALSTGLTSGKVYEIIAPGTAPNGAVTFTSSSGAGLQQAIIQGVPIQNVWATSDTASMAALAALINANPILNKIGTAVASSGTAVFTATANPGNGITAVAIGTGFTVNHAATQGGLTLAAIWQAVGLAVGVVPAIGVAFKANAAGAQSGRTTNTAELAAPAGLVLEVVGDANQTIVASPNPYIVVRFVGPTDSATTTPVATDPPNGSVVGLHFFFRNSTVIVGGE